MTTHTYERHEIASGLHRLAEMITACPDIPVNRFGVSVLLPITSGTEIERFGMVRELAERFARELNVDTDREVAVHFHFGGVAYKIYATSDEARRLHSAGTSYIESVTP